ETTSCCRPPASCPPGQQIVPWLTVARARIARQRRLAGIQSQLASETTSCCRPPASCPPGQQIVPWLTVARARIARQ
ncbi:hypothetical protein CKJ89_38160, partial [Klebsiella pneumoniae]